MSEKDKLSSFYFSRHSCSLHPPTRPQISGHSKACRWEVFIFFLGAHFHFLLCSKSASYCCCLCLVSREVHFVSFPGVLLLLLRLGHHVAEVGLELLIFLPTPLEYWDDRLAPSSFLGFFVCLFSWLYKPKDFTIININHFCSGFRHCP